MSRVVEAIQAIARQESAQHPYVLLGVVTSTFDADDGPDSHTISVQLKDSGLALNHIPLVSGVSGAAVLPKPGDVVVVLFPRGDLASAVAIGQVYSDQRRPPSFKRDEATFQWPGNSDDPEQEAVDLRVLAGAGKRQVTLTLGGDQNATCTVSNGQISLRAGGVQVHLRHSSDSDGTATVTAGGTKIELAQDGDLILEAAGTLRLKATAIKIEADTEVTINGQTVGIN